MRKFLTGLFFGVICLSFVSATGLLPKKQYLRVGSDPSYLKSISIRYWDVYDFPFLKDLKRGGYKPYGILIEPSDVRWPSGTVLVHPDISCDPAGSVNVSVEVFKAGETDASPTAPGANISCVVHLGRVDNFGTSPCDISTDFECVQNVAMTYSGADNGTYDVFEATINALPPGLYEFTCACSDNGPITDPLLPDPGNNIRWIGDADCPSVTPFINRRVTVNGATSNEDCSVSTAETVLAAVNAVDNSCSSDGKVWFKYVVTNGEVINISAAPLTPAQGVTEPEIYQVRLNSCAGEEVGPEPVCLEIGDILYIEVGQEDDDDMDMETCPALGNFTLTITDEDNGVPNDICADATDAAFSQNIAPGTGADTDNILECGEQGIFLGDPDACPDPDQASACFGENTEGVWYSFTIDDGVPTFSITVTGNGKFELFTGSCAALTSLGCAATNLVPVAGATYYLLVGPEGSVTVSSDFTSPNNDECAGATAFPDGGGTLTNQSNICADGETLSDCAAASDDFVVWYTFTVPATLENAIITLTPAGTYPIESPVLEVFESCGGPSFDFTCASTLNLTCLVPGETYQLAVGSADGDEGTFSLNIAFSDNGVANDACSSPAPITFPGGCQFVTVNGTTVNACPENFTGSACDLDDFPTVWYTVTLPAGGIGFEFEDVTGGANINVLNNVCTPPTQFGDCVTGDDEITGLTPGTYHIAVRTSDVGSPFSFDIKAIVPQPNYLCTNATTLSDNVTVNGSTNCAPAFNVSYCGLNTTNSHTVFFKYTVPATNTTNTRLRFTINANTALTGELAGDLNIGLFTNCTGSEYDASVEMGDLCDPTAGVVVVECVAPGTIITIAIGSQDGDEGDFSINVDEDNTGIPSNDLCIAPNPINFTANCDFVTVNGNTEGACPELFASSFCDLDDFPTVWYSVTLPANGIGFGFDNLVGNPNINIFNTNCTSPTQFGGSCITGETDVTPLPPGDYRIAVRTNLAGGPFSFDIKTIVPQPNYLCTSATNLSDNVPVNGSTGCAPAFNTSYCGLSTMTSHTVFFKYTVPASNTKNTNLEFTITPNSALTGTAATDLNIGLFTDCNGTVYNASVASGSLCNPVPATVIVECVAPGTELFIAIGSTDDNEGDFSITVNENGADIPDNDLCVDPDIINIMTQCEYQTVNGTSLNACPENFTGGACNLDDFATVWYSVTLPNGGIGVGFENLSAGLNIAIFGAGCPNPAQVGTCVTGDIELTTGFTQGTYLLAVRNTINGAPFSFDIKTILFLANDNPCEPGFIATPVSNGATLSNQNNVCATEDNECGGDAVENSLWYSFTLTSGFDKVIINVAGLTSPSISIYESGNPCNEMPINEVCASNGMEEFNCLPPGTYNIMVGTSTDNAGEFSITMTQGNNDGPDNDFCNQATQITIGPDQLCVPLDFTSSTENACPENLPASEIFAPCDFNAEETSWYIFTAPGEPGDQPTMDFTYTAYNGTGTPFMNVFEFGPDCSALNALENQCFQGLNNVFGNIGPLTPGQQYLIAISSFGDTGGDFDFTVKFNLGPPNDDKCHTASGYDLGSGGTLNNQSNLCSGGDYTIPDCPTSQSENSVWYTFTVDEGSYGVRIFIDQWLNNGMPILGPVAAGIFEDGCNSNIVEATGCFPIKTDYDFDCLEPGTYDLMLATSNENAGEFHITITQLADDRSCPNGDVPNLSDKCEDAIEIDMAGIICEDIIVKSCNLNACPESFFSGGCSYNEDPTVWFEFTPDAMASTIDLTNMPAGYYYSILEGSPCTDSPPTALAGAGCLTAANTTGIQITGGETYYLIIASDANDAGDFNFRIRQNLLPENDDPIPGSDRPPFELELEGTSGHSSTTCCAVGFNDDPNLDVPNVQCAGASNDNAVWYTYTTGDEIGFEVQVDASGSNPISGNVTVEVLSGTAAGPGGALFTPTSYSCGQAPAIVKVSCYEPGEVIWIKVASSDDNCGQFSINIVPLNRCQMADECDEIGAGQMIGPTITDPNCGAFEIFSADGCLENACPQDDINGCGESQNPTVWFQVEVDEEAVQLVTFITTDGTWQPVWAIYQGECGALELVNGGTIDEPTPCSNGDSNVDEHSVGVIEGVTTYYIAVSADGIIDDPNFHIDLYSSAGCVSCIGGEIGCNTTATFLITERSSDRPLDDPFFCQGEEVTVCINYFYDASATGVDWFHGLIPDFGPGWDMSAFDPEDVVVSPGSPDWNDEDDGDCAPFITEQMPLLCTYTDPATGRLKLCNIACQTCPCEAPMLQGAPLPSGWFWNTNGGAGCENECSPSTRYGIGSVQATVNICVNLTVREFDTEDECLENRSLQINFQTTSDGVSGCWNDPVAECKLDKAQIGPNWQIDCDRPPKVLGEDFELCKEGMIDIDLDNEDGLGNVTIIVEPIPNPEVSGAMSHVFPNGSGTIDDYLISSSAATTIQKYEAYVDAPNIQCPAPRDTFEVTIYPELIVTLDPINICAEDIDGETITAFVVGGTGNYVSYDWSNGDSGPTITAFYDGPDSYSITVTDDKGCSGSANVDVTKLIPLSFDIEPENIITCQQYATFEVLNVVSNGSPFIYWNVPPQLYFEELGGNLTINTGLSDITQSPYTLVATLVDQFNCTITKEATIDITLPPTVELTYIQPACGVLTVDLVIQNYSSPTGGAPTFRLLDCSDNQLFGNINGTFGPYVSYDPEGIFEDVDLSLINCFRLLVEEDGGCSFITDDLVVPITTGIPVQLSPALTICNGQSATISVTNAAVYNGGSIVWSNGATGPSITVTPGSTTLYSVTATQANGCVSNASRTITVNDLPTPGITGSTTFCPGENTQLTATGGNTYAWSGPGGFTAAMASTGPINVPGLYTVTVTNQNNCTAVASTTISQSDNLVVTIAPLNLCDNEPGILDAGAGFTSYIWKDPAGMEIGNTQTVSVNAAGSYTVEVTQGSCIGSGVGLVINNNSPVLNLPATLTVCRQNTGIGPTTINFVSYADTLNGEWFNIDDAPVNTSNWGNVDFTSLPTAGTFRFVFTTDNAIPPCVDVSDTITVTVNNCACPTPALNTTTLCNSRTAPFNLSTLFVGTPPTGDWTVVAPSPTPFPTITGSNLNVLNIAEGVYTLRYTYNPPTPGNCPKFIETTISVFAAPKVTGSNITLCNQNIGAGPTTVDLNTLLSGLSEPSPGSWKQIDGPVPGGTIPNIDVTGMAVDTLRFEYTTTAVAPCAPEKVVVQVFIRNCECPVVELKDDVLCNGSNTPIDLQDAVRFTVNPSSVVGTWTVTAPLTLSGGKFVNPFGIAAGTYDATFKISGSVPAGCQSTFTKKITIRNQPVAVMDKNGTACQASTGNGPTTANLFSLLKSGYTSGGTWTQVSPAAPVLGITPGGVVDFTGQTPGTVFTFRYTVNATSPCTPVTADVMVTVQDCNCPDGNVDCPNCDLCNDGGTLDLTSTYVNAATIAPGVWTVTGPGGAVISLSGGTFLNATGLPAGQYTATYTLTPPPTGPSCPKSDNFKLFIRNKVTAIVKSDTLVCNGQTGIKNFPIQSMFISGGTGSWVDEDGNTITNLNPSIDGLPDGSVINVTYVINNADPCEDSRYPVTIRITNNCNCPPINLGTIPEVCTSQGSIDLKPFSDPKPGVWSSTNPALVITDGVLTLTGLSAGSYTLRYELTGDIDPSCVKFKNIQIKVSVPKSAGTASAAEFCRGASDVVNLFDRLDNEDTGGVWTVVSGGATGFNAANATFSLAGRPAGVYVFKYAFSNQAPCPNDEEEVTIRINELPVADAGPDKTIDCTVLTALLGGTGTSTGPDFTYEWKQDGAAVATTPTFTALTGGSFTISVVNKVTGCTDADTVLVVQSADLPVFDFEVDSVFCFGETGRIELKNLRGGKSPYQISFDGGKTFGTSLVAANLKEGTYDVVVKDASGCINTRKFVLDELPELIIKLGNDFFLNIGEDSLLSIKGQYDELTAKSVTWKANGDEITSAKNSPELLAKPDEDTEYTVTVVDKDGCEDSDNIFINIRRVKPECVPNVFTPNDLDGNNYFSINCAEVERVTKYSIYDRWGNLMFTGKDLLPDQPQTFWDGKFKGQPVVPGVYVFYIEMLFKDGSLEKRGGDVTVIK